MRRNAGGTGPIQPARQSGASVSSPTIDCTSCGACCFGGHDRYIALLPQDRDRTIPETATTEIGGRRFMTMSCGHCAQLGATADGRLICAIYEERPEACRAFRAGSFECNKARQHRGIEAEALRAFALAQKPSAPPHAAVVPISLPIAGPMQGPGPGGEPPAEPVSPSP
ncbi:YkgJ family cysteine cluster protein [Roseicyclus sp.]|uniref:YkgJ family cysteine cluster protein n=1 Tax=Roseicyclus sp. TaxID=1914329 RepID=UPI003F6ADDCC